MSTDCTHDWPSPEDELTCLDDAEVVLRCERDPAVSVRFAQRHAVTDPLDRRLMFAVLARAPGLDARLTGVTNHVMGRGLARFIEGLDVRGWPGEQRWTNADRDLVVSAAHESGHIGLTWLLRPWRRSSHGDWTASATTWLEAGAASDTFAAELHVFLTADGFLVDYHESDNIFH